MPDNIVRRKKRKTRRFDGALIFGAIILFIALSVNSMSSFLYWTNNWVDTNATWVLAKSMFFEHKVLYKDIYDQRGIILYIIYGVGSIISAILATKTSFIGLFILEYAVGIVNLIFSKKLLIYWGSNINI